MGEPSNIIIDMAKTAYNTQHTAHITSESTGSDEGYLNKEAEKRTTPSVKVNDVLRL